MPSWISRRYASAPRQRKGVAASADPVEFDSVIEKVPICWQTVIKEQFRVLFVCVCVCVRACVQMHAQLVGFSMPGFQTKGDVAATQKWRAPSAEAAFGWGPTGLHLESTFFSGRFKHVPHFDRLWLVDFLVQHFRGRCRA